MADRGEVSNDAPSDNQNKNMQPSYESDQLKDAMAMQGVEDSIKAFIDKTKSQQQGASQADQD